MSLAYSTQMPPGTQAPDFRLEDAVSGKVLGLEDLKGDQATVVMFICNHCPYVKHVQAELVRLAQDYQPHGVGFIAISANDAASYPQDAPPRMAEVARQAGYPFPYLHDETQTVARAYGAVCTPEFFVFDAELVCVYHGRLDDSTPGSGVAPSGEDVRRALDAVMAGAGPTTGQRPAMGCSIKWK